MIGGNPHWFVEEMTRRVAQERDGRAEVVLNGLVADFADYRFAVGFLEGMQFALGIAEDIKKDMDAQ